MTYENEIVSNRITNEVYMDTETGAEISQEAIDATAKKLAEVHQEFTEFLSRAMQERQINPLVVAQMAALQSCSLTWCALIEDGHATNDDIRNFWLEIIERVRKTELTDAALDANRVRVAEALKSLPAEEPVAA